MIWSQICVDLKLSQDDCKAVMHVPETVIYIAWQENVQIGCSRHQGHRSFQTGEGAMSIFSSI